MHRIDITKFMAATLVQIAYLTGVSMTTVKRRVRQARKDNLCHISGYRPPAGPGRGSPVFTAGHGADAVEPAALTNTEYARAFYKRKKQRAASWLATLLT